VDVTASAKHSKLQLIRFDVPSHRGHRVVGIENNDGRKFKELHQEAWCRIADKFGDHHIRYGNSPPRAPS
jgi:hypothetical protein